MAHSGINTYFALGDATNVLTPVSTYLDGVTMTSEPDDLDGTTFQPGVAAPTRVKVPGFRERGASLSGKWTAAAHTFFSSVEGLQDRTYEYGPIGNTTGLPKDSGTANVLSYSRAVSTVDGVTTFTVELAINTVTAGVF